MTDADVQSHLHDAFGTEPHCNPMAAKSAPDSYVVHLSVVTFEFIDRRDADRGWGCNVTTLNAERYGTYCEFGSLAEAIEASKGVARDVVGDTLKVIGEEEQ